MNCDWNKVLSKNDPLNSNSVFFTSDLPFSENLKKLYEKLNKKDKQNLDNIFKNAFVVDLGCGNPNQSNFIQELSKNSKYVGVDIGFPKDPEERILKKSEKEIYLRNDMLSFLENLLDCNEKLIFIINGIEIAKENEVSKKYVAQLTNQILRIKAVSKYVLIGPGTHGIDFEKVKSLNKFSFYTNNEKLLVCKLYELD